MIRSQPTVDEAVPNTHGLYAQALLKLTSLTGEAQMRERADRLVATLGSAVLNNPYGHASLLNAIDQRLGEVQIVILGEGIYSSALRNAALATPFLNRTVRPAAITTGSEQFPEIAGHPKDKPAAFACTEGRCSLPATRPEEIALRLASLRR